MSKEGSKGAAFERLEAQVLAKSRTRRAYQEEGERLKNDPGVRMSALAPQVGQILKAARQKRHRTQGQQSAASGIVQSEVSRIEKGGGALGPSMETIVNYAHALDMEVVLMLKPREAELPLELVEALDHTALVSDEDAAKELSEGSASVRLWGVF